MREQPVPPYSAAKHEGQPLYKLARKGATTPAKIKRMEISQADMLDASLPFVRFRVACSSGTYIRSLAHSLGMRLGCGAVLTELTREFSHPFGLEAAAICGSSRPIPPCWLPACAPLPRRCRTGQGWSSRRRKLCACATAWPCPGRSWPMTGPAAESGKESALLLHRGEALALAQGADSPAGRCWTVLRGLWK